MLVQGDVELFADAVCNMAETLYRCGHGHEWQVDNQRAHRASSGDPRAAGGSAAISAMRC